MVSICFLQIVLIINLFQQKAKLTYQMLHIIDFIHIDVLSFFSSNFTGGSVFNFTCLFVFIVQQLALGTYNVTS